MSISEKNHQYYTVYLLLAHLVLLHSREERKINKSPLITHPKYTIRRGIKNTLFYTNKISNICHTVFLNIASISFGTYTKSLSLGIFSDVCHNIFLNHCLNTENC